MRLRWTRLLRPIVAITLFMIGHFLWWHADSIRIFTQTEAAKDDAVLQFQYQARNSVYLHVSHPRSTSLNTSATKVRNELIASLRYRSALTSRMEKQHLQLGLDKPLALEKVWKTIPFLDAPNLPRVLNETQYDLLINVFHRMDRFFTDYNITWIMSFGTLLGSYMSHNLLPWDDDLDICIFYKDVQKVCKLHNQGIMKKRYDLGLYVYRFPCHNSRGDVFTPNHSTIHKCDRLKMKIFDTLSTLGNKYCPGIGPLRM